MRIGDLMQTSGVGFGTSGARGRVIDMTDYVCHSYALGFLDYLAETGALKAGQAVALAGDYRPSSGRILAACVQAVHDAGCVPRYCGRIPAPALATFAFAHGMPSMMVTGSHIPDDRNGIKFNLPDGEVLKEDEAGIARQELRAPGERFDGNGCFRHDLPDLPAPESAALDGYLRRYLDFFPRDSLAGLRIGLYAHSTVAREALGRILSGLGAEVRTLGFSETFVPVDTEAIRPEDRALALGWCAEGAFDALVSADGDGDRPLLADASGAWLRGDILGLLCARALGARGVALPVSCNTALERANLGVRVERTRIGSPYVIAGMRRLLAAGVERVVGYEANGGFLLGSDICRDGRCLGALPTRDAAIVAVAVLAEARARGVPLAELCAALPARFTASERITDFPIARARARLEAFNSGDLAGDIEAFARAFGAVFGAPSHIDHTDGVRATLADAEILHLRPSGNAPELRVYTEAACPERAARMAGACLEMLRAWR